MSTDVKDYIKELRDAIMFAGLNYDIYWVYKGSRPTYVKTMNRYVSFFTTSLQAHFAALVITLYRLYEERTDTFNIPFLLAKLRKQDELSHETLDSLNRIYTDKAKPLWEKISILRNKAFAHRCSAHTVLEVFKKADIALDEPRELIEVTKELLNQLTQARDGDTHAFNLDAREDTLWLLKDLKYAQEKRKAEEEN